MRNYIKQILTSINGFIIACGINFIAIGIVEAAQTDSCFVVGASLSAGFNASDDFGFQPLSMFLQYRNPNVSFIDLTAAGKACGMIDLLAMMNNGYKVASRQLNVARRRIEAIPSASSKVSAIGLDLLFWHIQNPGSIPEADKLLYTACSNGGLDWANNLLDSYGIGDYEQYVSNQQCAVSEAFKQRVEGLCLLMHKFNEIFEHAIIATIPEINIRLGMFRYPAPPKNELHFINDVIRCSAWSAGYSLIEIDKRFHAQYPVIDRPQIKRSQILSKDGIHLNRYGLNHFSREISAMLMTK